MSAASPEDAVQHVTHELRNALVAIRLNAEVVRSRVAAHGDVHACLDDIEAAADQAAELLARLVTLARPRRG